MKFIDTNVLVYAASGLPSDRRKSRAARTLLEGGGFGVSLQVLQEFYVVARHPKKLALSHEEAVVYCKAWRRFTVLAPDLELFVRALFLCSRYQIGYFDAAILAAAQTLKCTVVYSEDLNHQHNYNGVRVINPFALKPIDDGGGAIRAKNRR